MQRERQRSIYRSAARTYDRLVSAEDADGCLRKALVELVEAVGSPALRVIDVGTGTGRMARLVGERARLLVGVDTSLHMLRAFRPGSVLSSVAVAADSTALPAPIGAFDLAMAGWVFGHATVWQSDRWLASVARSIEELERVTRPGGTLLIAETLGTGVAAPAPPTPSLAAYYDWLETGRDSRDRSCGPTTSSSRSPKR